MVFICGISCRMREFLIFIGAFCCCFFVRGSWLPGRREREREREGEKEGRKGGGIRRGVWVVCAPRKPSSKGLIGKVLDTLIRMKTHGSIR